MASDSSRPQPDDVQAAINAALARKRAEAQSAGERLEPHLGGPAGRRSIHEADEIGPVPMADEGPAPEIPPMPQYFEPDRAVQPGETVRREAGARTKKRSLVWFFGPVLGVPAVIIIALVYYLGVEMQGEGVQDSAPLIAAPSEPAKVKPTDEGGLAVPDQDKLIYGEIAPSEAQQPVEQLLPEPEQPQVPAASDEQTIAPSTEGLTPPPAPTIEVPPNEPVENAVEAAPAEAVESSEPAANGEPATGAEAAASAPAEAPATTEPATAAPAEAATAPAPAETQTASKPTSGFRIQIAALKSEEAAGAAWNKLQGKYPDLLGDLQPTIQRIDLGANGIFYRVQGGPLDGRIAAQDLCGKLNQRGQQCLVVQP